MLLIEQVCEKSNIKSDFVKCPSCKRGRLCDKPVGAKVSTNIANFDHNNVTDPQIIIKCPKCGQKFIIHLSK